MSTEDRKTVAQELAAKGGQDWEKLSPEMVNAYLHNADLVIEERNRPPVDEVNPKPLYTCDRCQDTAYIGGKRCGECNPMGLLVEQVHPQATVVEVDEVACLSEESLLARSEFPGKETEGEIVIEVERVYSPPDAEEVKRTRELKPTEYRCSKCSKPGKTIIHMLKKGGKGIGHKHQEFAVKVN